MFSGHLYTSSKTQAPSRILTCFNSFWWLYSEMRSAFPLGLPFPGDCQFAGAGLESQGVFTVPWQFLCIFQMALIIFYLKSIICIYFLLPKLQASWEQEPPPCKNCIIIFYRPSYHFRALCKLQLLSKYKWKDPENPLLGMHPAYAKTDTPHSIAFHHKN